MPVVATLGAVGLLGTLGFAAYVAIRNHRRDRRYFQAGLQMSRFDAPDSPLPPPGRGYDPPRASRPSRGGWEPFEVTASAPPPQAASARTVHSRLQF